MKKPKFKFNVPAGSGLDETNTEVCQKGSHFCAFMTAALAENGSLVELFAMRGNGYVAFTRKRRNPVLILNSCPWCREEI